jgi:hypothetical protein
MYRLLQPQGVPFVGIFAQDSLDDEAQSGNAQAPKQYNVAGSCPSDARSDARLVISNWDGHHGYAIG